MRLKTLQRGVSLLAFCGGVAAAVAIVAAGWMPASKQRLGLDLRILAHRSGWERLRERNRPLATLSDELKAAARQAVP